MTGASSFLSVLELRSGTVLAVGRNASDAYSIFRSTDGGATFPTVAFNFPLSTAVGATTQLLHSQSWFQRIASVSNDVFFGEYGDSRSAMSVYRSADDGRTFAKRCSWPTTPRPTRSGGPCP